MELVIGILCVLVLLVLILIIVFRPRSGNDPLSGKMEALQSGMGENFRANREENAVMARDNRLEMNAGLKDFKSEMSGTLANITGQNQMALEKINRTLEEKMAALILRIDDNNRAARDELSQSLRNFSLEQRAKFDELKGDQKEVFKDFQESFSKNVESFNNLQREKFGQLEEKQDRLIDSTEKKLEEMRVMVDEKLQKTLNERLGQSFELVGRQLESVQKGLGEMQVLAQDVGGLKKVLSNVKMRGGFGEVQLSLLLEQILAPDQYESNVKTKSGSTDLVEFAIRLPGRDDNRSVVWIPIDAKFPKDVYEQLQTAHDIGDLIQIDLAQKNLELTIKRMAKDISDKYIDPPNTTDFAIMFLPFEGIYAEVVRKASMLEYLQREYKIIVTGPTTLAAILNSLQMGFRSLAIQKRSSEVWQVLGAVKREFENFGGMLEKAQKNLQTASNQIDEVMGKRTRAIQRKLKGVEALNETDMKMLIPEPPEGEIIDEELDS
ncbi:DNA recombination protein RmuC [Flavitalea flava]